MNESPSQAEAVPDVGDPLEPREDGGRDMEAEGLAGTTEGPVQGGGDTEFGGCLTDHRVPPKPPPAIPGEPEPDVLERGRTILDDTTEGGISPTGRVREFVADAMAEIECERAEHAECCETLAKMDGQLVRAAQQLRAITDAKPVMYQHRSRNTRKTRWWPCSKMDYQELKASGEDEVRALAVVAPKGDTE